MIKIDNKCIELNYYNDGSPRLNLDVSEIQTPVNIEWLYAPHEEMLLYYIVKHIRNHKVNIPIILYMPYVENARGDRVKNNSEIFVLRYFCEFINNLNFNEVVIKDVHSYVTPALLNRSTNIIPYNKINILIDKIKPDIIFYPDNTAMKRYSDSIKHPYIYAEKRRNWEDGKILDLRIIGEISTNYKTVLCVDDIISSGESMYYPIKELQKYGVEEFYIYATHVEPTIMDKKRLLLNENVVKMIYTTRSIFNNKHEKIQIME